MAAKYTIGLDFGTNSVRALVVDVSNGREVGTSVADFRSGQRGVLLDPGNPHLARQNPADYLEGLVTSVRNALAQASANSDFDAANVIGIGVDTTGSTPMPVDAIGQPLAFQDRFRNNLNAYVWLWKDHTSHAEARRITQIAAELRPQYLAKCGGTYSSEWYWSKILHCLAVAPDVFDAAHTWVEHADWMPAILTGTERPAALRRSICAAGHKAMFSREWGGYPDARFLAALDPRLVRLHDALPSEAHTVAEAAGGLTEEWAERLGLQPGIPVAVGAFDAHLGAIGSGIRPGTLVKIIGTSTCDLMVSPIDRAADVPGLCGVVPESVLPDLMGLEAGQSAVGDIFNWLVEVIEPQGKSHAELTAEAEQLKPGESGLLALDWHNGNRTVLVDQRLTGLIVGLTLHSTPAEIYRALVESTAFGARIIMERYEEYGDAVDRIVNCGGIAEKNPMVMQIYADVMGRPIQISRSAQTCALGAAIAGAVVAGADDGGHDSFATAMMSMTAVQPNTFEPDERSRAVYDRLYAVYRQLHDAFGVRGTHSELYSVMKTLLEIRDEVKHA